MRVTVEEALAAASKVAASVLAPNAERIDREARWPAESLRALQGAGLGGLVVPAAAGGMGLGLHAVARVCEVLGAACASSSMCFGMHLVGSAVIAAKATAPQTEAYLRPIARGEHLTTLSLSEPGTGVHFYIPRAELAHGGDGYRVTGRKAFVTNGGHADSYVMSVAAAGAAAPIGEFSLVVVDGDAPGLAWGEPWDGIGMRGNSSVNVDLREVPVPAANLLGEEGDEIWYVFQVVAPYFLTAMAGTYLGVASAALDAIRGSLKERRYATGGGPAQEPIVQHRLGELYAIVDRTRALVHDATRRADGGDPHALPALLSTKAEAASAAESVTMGALALAGGSAFARGNVLDRLHRDARASHVMAPPTDMLRTWTGRWLLGEPLLQG